MKRVEHASSLRRAFFNLCEHHFAVEHSNPEAWANIRAGLAEFGGRHEYRAIQGCKVMDRMGIPTTSSELWMGFTSDEDQALFILTWAS